MAKGKPPVPPDIRFDTRTSDYWLQLADGRYLRLDARNVKLHLMSNSIYIDEENDFGLKSGDALLISIQKTRWIDYAGPLAGHKIGPFETPDGKRILVTSQARIIEPKSGDFAGIEKFITELFSSADQVNYVLCWLKISYDCLRTRNFRPGQFLMQAGPPGCGKSFFQELVTWVLGGRSAKPYRYMTGQTHFNSDLAAAEHLMIEDENPKSNITARREFGTAIKDWTVNDKISVHAKGREAVTLSFFRRLTGSVNDETENLMIMPPMDSSILDKVSLLKCHHATLSDKRQENLGMLRTELPGFLHMLKTLSVPRAMRDPRFGIRAYHNPEILEVLSETSPEARLLTLIDQCVAFDDLPESERKTGSMNVWRGTSEKLEARLRASPFAFAVDKLLPFTAAMGTYLSRLAHKKPERFTKLKSRGQTVWLITLGETENAKE